jgi:hypothetical protein
MEVKMNGWAIAFIALTTTRVCVAWINHGKKKEEKFCTWNGWTRTWVTAIDIFILIKAGTFN